MKPEFANISYEDYCEYLKRNFWEFLVQEGIEANIEINDRLDDTQIHLKTKDRKGTIWLEAWVGEFNICYEIGTVKRCTTRPIMSWEWMIECKWYFKKKVNHKKDSIPLYAIEMKDFYPSHNLKTQITRLKSLKNTT
jgi:hypothetical protein